MRILGEASNLTMWRLARMNFAMRGIDGNHGLEPADGFDRDVHKDLKADYILANPCFRMSDSGGDLRREDARCEFSVAPAGNANHT